MAREWIAVCSAKPRPMAQNARSYSLKTGDAAWGRDVYHLRHSGITTLCGRDLTDWLTIGPIEKLDHHCCKRCAEVAALRSFSTACAPWSPKFLNAEYVASFAA